MANSYPFKWTKVPEELENERQKLFEFPSGRRNGVVSEPLGIHLSEQMTEVGEKVYNFKLRPDDIWIVTYPKCGTTWTQVSFLMILREIFASGTAMSLIF